MRPVHLISISGFKKTKIFHKMRPFLSCLVAVNSFYVRKTKVLHLFSIIIWMCLKERRNSNRYTYGIFIKCYTHLYFLRVATAFTSKQITQLLKMRAIKIFAYSSLFHDSQENGNEY